MVAHLGHVLKHGGNLQHLVEVLLDASAPVHDLVLVGSHLNKESSSSSENQQEK